MIRGDAVGKFFPEIKFPTKASTGMCATVFEELDAAVSLLDITRKEFNPTQRQLIGRFLIACKMFGHEMLVADGDSEALRVALGLSLSDSKTEKSPSDISGTELINSVCMEVCSDLDKIGQTLQSELLTGVADVVASIRASYDLEDGERDALDSVASAVRHLAQQVTALFDVQPYIFQQHFSIYQANIESENDGKGEETLRITAEQFMQNVKPPERKATLRDRLQPFIPELTRLRQEGYTYAQCAQFLEENGIKTYIGAISGVMNGLR